ncbi:MAG: HAMP domain-containing protein [Alphaproteobacteria bacterium]|nr:HAMP domain-containing protein [Alphaproteobacteria bacterium]
MAEAAPLSAPRRSSASLMRRLLLPNLIPPVILVAGLIGLGDLREALIEARLDAVAGRAELIAGALGESAIAGGSEAHGLDEEAARQIVLRLVVAPQLRARLFDEGGVLLVDTRRHADAGRRVEREALPPPDRFDPLAWFEARFRALIGRPLPPVEEKFGESAADFPEALAALDGEPAVARRERADGVPVIAASVPVTRLRKVVGALVLSEDAVEIDREVAAQRLRILEFFALSLAASIAVSLLLAAGIARPLRRLAEAAETVRRAPEHRAEIPDLAARGDEIGGLSAAMAAMTQALYARLDANEAFAADVAHELRGPLASLRSALEALAVAPDEVTRRRLEASAVLAIRRMDRLITEIAEASRLDAELSRARYQPLDLAAFVRDYVAADEDAAPPGAVKLAADLPGPAITVMGDAAALGRLLGNLVDNARSFSPPGGTVRLRLSRDGGAALAVEDDGPGIRENDLERVFERFHTDRPQAPAGEWHAGLGLGLARQIAHAHGGTLAAENRRDVIGKVAGARLVLRLPLAGDG